jgi:hypothetical protein
MAPAVIPLHYGWWGQGFTGSPWLNASEFEAVMDLAQGQGLRSVLDQMHTAPDEMRSFTGI